VSGARGLLAQLRGWLRRNLPPAAERDLWDSSDPDAQWDSWRRWRLRLWRARWAAVSWPREWGGRSGTLTQEFLVHEALALEGCPPVMWDFAAFATAGLLRARGSAAQRRLIPRMLSGEDVCCVGWTEPQAGSDLSRIQTRALARPGGFVLRGRKKWTHEAHRARWCLTLALTGEPGDGRSSLFLVELPRPGVSVSRIEKMTGESNACEVVFDDAPLPREALIGPLHSGWKVFWDAAWCERFLTADTPRTLGALERLRPLLPAGAPVLERLCAEAEALRWTTLAYLADTARLGPSLPQASLVKLRNAELTSRIADEAARALGAGALRPPRRGPDWFLEALKARTRQLGRGTAEMHRSLIARVALGLPGAGR
jgi:alkylation response protein AidB-like acyl-CoA dehydrogenase